jgi:hypothetical protein
MPDYEKLGAFYLGRQFDMAAGQPRPDLLLYDARDLTTHAVVVGMTGSGKTGLCIGLLEEAAIDGIPAIAIDPKGDLGNLLLAFPELRPEDFLPWVDPAEAARRGQSVEAFATATAQTWREGLAAWDQTPERIARFRDAADVAIYTPGSSAGLPLAVLRTLSAPPAALRDDADALRDRVSGTVSGLLALLGVEADPLQSREHILLATIVQQAWQAGRDLDLAALLRAIQSPPFDKVGLLDLESFFPAKDRAALGIRLNNLAASPGFAAWTEGEPLDVARLLHTAAGKPRLSIISIAHLGDAERMFFVTLLLNEVLAWVRGQSGTSSLRAILYMDEVFGYFPPTANPPSKQPMLTLLKQARAFGLGVVLATQNPVDLDYKGLSNAGTWFLGRLQTERDKARVLEGLEGASATSGAAFDRSRMEALLAGLGQRVFLMNNVHEDQPTVFQSRWALSYLRGPLARDQIANLMRARKATGEPPAPPVASSPAAVSPARATAAVSAGAATGGDQRPVLPPGVPEFFLRGAPPSGEAEYRPALFGAARLHFVQSSSGIDVWRDVTRLVPLDEDTADAPWDAEPLEHDARAHRDAAPAAGTRFAPLPAAFTNARNFARLTGSLKDCLYRTANLALPSCPALKLVAAPDETEGQFRVRLATAAREERDRQVDKLRARYAPKLSALGEQIRRAEQRVEREKSQASQQTWQTAISFGSSILGALFGRKLASRSNVTGAASAMRSASRAAQQRADVTQATDSVEALRQKLADLEAQFQAEAAAVQQSLDPQTLALEELHVRPRKSDLTVTEVALCWVP